VALPRRGAARFRGLDTRPAAWRGADAAPERESARPFPPTRQLPPKEFDPLFAKVACIDLAHPLARILLLDLLSLRVVLRQSNRDIADRLPPVESADFRRWRRSGNRCVNACALHHWHANCSYGAPGETEARWIRFDQLSGLATSGWL